MSVYQSLGNRARGEGICLNANGGPGGVDLCDDGLGTAASGAEIDFDGGKRLKPRPTARRNEQEQQ